MLQTMEPYWLRYYGRYRTDSRVGDVGPCVDCNWANHAGEVKVCKSNQINRVSEFISDASGSGSLPTYELQKLPELMNNPYRVGTQLFTLLEVGFRNLQSLFCSLIGWFDFNKFAKVKSGRKPMFAHFRLLSVLGMPFGVGLG